MGKLTARLQGGLGNQMFIAAAGALLARRLDRTLQFDVSAFEKDSQRAFALGYFDSLSQVPMTATSFSKRQRVRDTARRLAGVPNRNLFRQTGFDYAPEFETVASCDRLSGYFQSRHYVNSDPAFVRSLFAVSKESDLQQFIRSAVGDVFTGVHVRRGDYLLARNQAVHGICDASYYSNAIELLHSLGAANHPIVTFTDSASELPLAMRRASALVVEDTDGRAAAEDLLALADASSLVLSNSSFSWWAAFLGGNADSRHVVAPRPWAHRGDFSASGLLYPHWIALGASS